MTEQLKASRQCTESLSPSATSVRALILVILTGFDLRVLVAATIAGGLDREFPGDQPDYTRLAGQVIAGQGFVNLNGDPSSHRMPGLPLLLAMLVSVAGSDPVAIRVFMCAVTSMLIPACFLLVRSITDSRTALWMAGIAALFPSWVFLAGEALTDVPTAVCVTMMTWMLIEAHRRQAFGWVVGAGILWGMATSMRAVCLALAPGIIVWLCLTMPGWKKRFVAVTAAIAPLVCILAPWSVRNALVHDTFVLLSTQGGTELYKSNNPEATGILAYDHPYFKDNLADRYPKDRYPGEALRSKLYHADAVRFIYQNPGRFAKLCLIRAMEFWKPASPRAPRIQNLAMIASFGLALPFFLFQAARRGWRRGPELLLLLIIACHMAVHVVFTSSARYRIPVEPLVVVMAFAGFCALIGRRPVRA